MDRRNAGDAERVWFVDTGSRMDIIQNPEAYELPPLGSQHPDAPRMRLNAYRVSPEGLFHVVRGIYSTSTGGLIRERNDEDDPNYVSWVGGYEIVTEMLRVVKRTRKDFFLPPDTTEVRYPYLPIQIPSPETRPRWIMVVNVPSLSAEQFRVIERQTNALHFISGREWWFRGCELRQVNPALWRLEYTWVGDNGTPWSEDMRHEPPAEVLFPEPVFYDGVDLIRIPHTSFLPYYPELRDAEDRPNWHVVNRYNRADYDGWRLLPGVS